MFKNAVDELEELSNYVAGFAAGRDDESLEKASKWLRKLKGHICGQGYIGCNGGRNCSSDHK